MSCLDHPIISQRYFFPRREAPPSIFAVNSAGIQLACYRLAPHENTRTLVYFHGNGEVVNDYIPDLAQAFVSLGVNLLLAEYRGYGASQGEPALAAMLDDTTAIVESLALPPERLVIFGRSVGSIYAIELASRFPGIAGLVLESGIADPLERVLLRVDPGELGVSDAELQAEVRQKLDHQRKLSGYRGPLLVMHTENDGLVSKSHAERLHHWAGSETKKLVLFQRGDHNTILWANQQQYFEELYSFLSEL